MKRFLILVFLCICHALFGQTVETLTTSFNGSGGVSVNADGDIFVGNFGQLLNNANGTQVMKVTLDGSVTTFATGLLGASGNDFDSEGNLYQSNIAGNRVSKILPDGTVSTFASANIVNPVGVAVDDSNFVYVVNCRTPGQIVRITPGGQASVFVTNALMSCPNGLTLDNDGNLYTCNFNNGNVIKVTPGGQVSVLATMPGGNNGHLTFANGLLYVVDRGGNQIHEVKLDGTRTLLAGTGACGKADGPALQSTWSFPNGIRASVTGDTLFVNDAVPLCNQNLNPVVIRMIIGVKSVTSVEDQSRLKPADFGLNQNYPNPFNPATTIRYSIPESQHVKLTIYNQLGERVRMLVDAVQPAGARSVSWDGRDERGVRVSSGAYVYKLVAGELTQSKQMVLVK